MPAVVLDLLKYLFLAVLYIFVARAVRAVYLELRASERAVPMGAPPPGRAASRRAKRAPTKAVVVEGDVAKRKQFDISGELTIGRSDKCKLVLNDTYVSQMHARIFTRGQSVMLEDLGSTNGTYLNRRRISAPAELQRGDRVKIGKTVLEMRK
jgi:pSer/pThr/pTyr-binding forkhead associated (FHA) protein